MRIISVWILLDDNTDEIKAADLVEAQFPERLPEYTRMQDSALGNTIMYWNRIVIGDNRDMNDVVKNIRLGIPGCRVFSDEHGTEITTFRKYGVHIGIGISLFVVATCLLLRWI